jgi:hypothetical protein
VEHGTQAILRDKEGLSAEKIAEKVRSILLKEHSSQEPVRVG